MTLPQDLAWLILLLPLAAAVGNAWVPRPDPTRSARLSITAVALAFMASLVLFLACGQGPATSASGWTWLDVGGLKVVFRPQLDPLSLLMLLVVTGVGGAIHVYSWGYMDKDPGFSRYFASLSFFTFSMVGIVLANNFVTLFVFWELVGLSSYLLIGFWFERPAAADAAKKAFLTNRVGDFGFLLGILMVWALAGSVDFEVLRERWQLNPAILGGVGGLAGVLLFCGAMGKSAQFPLHVWLPDAMEGPTPVSALIHAATMVAAGVYMLCRIFFLLGAPALEVVAWMGGITAILSASMALQQDDIKRILAYSTLSQLGYMVMAVGLGGPGAAMYHLATHASFKALLFLGAGSVILALHHEQNIWRMGGLGRRMPVTYWTFLLATLALCGVPPFSGFFSKDEVLSVAAHHSVALFVLGVVVAVLTTLYMFRLFFVAFRGEPRSEAAAHAVESPKIMTWPLVVLAVPTVLAGAWGIDHFLDRHFHPGVEVHTSGWVDRMFSAMGHSPLAALFGLAAAGTGFTLAWLLYREAEQDPVPGRWGGWAGLLRHRFYFDEIYGVLIRCTQDAMAALADWVDRWIVAGLLVRGAHGTAELMGRMLRLLQTGNLQTYAFLLVAGVVVLLFWVLGK